MILAMQQSATDDGEASSRGQSLQAAREAIQQAINSAQTELSLIQSRESARGERINPVKVSLEQLEVELRAIRDEIANAPDSAVRREGLARKSGMDQRKAELQQSIARVEQQESDAQTRDIARKSSLQQELERLEASLKEAERLEATNHGDTLDSHRQVIQNATAELELLGQEEVEIQTRVPSLQAQIAILQTRITARESRVTQAVENARRQEELLKLAQTQANIARGTAQSEAKQLALKAQAKTLEQSERERDALLSESEASSEQEHLAGLSEELEYCLARLAALPQEKRLLEGARFEAHRELGEQIRNGIDAELLAADANIALLQKQLDAAQAARLATIREGIERLTEWPAHQGELRGHLPYTDSTLEVLRAGHAFTQALLTHGRWMADVLPLPSLHGRPGHLALLEIPMVEVRSVWSDSARLRDRDTALARICEEYKAWKHR